ncbi:MAG: TlpA family protein disulfide reductase [Gammaproteobacteria bacterium]|nr:TlpA family protein disulfide reductase [Gammaproteobacteria bacterium]
MKFGRLGVLMLCSAALFNANAADNQTLPALDKPFMAPEFTTMSESGKSHSLSDYRGKLVILNFWASWCPPCRYEMPSMERLWQQVQGKPVVILAVNVGEDADTIFEFTGHYPVSFPLLLDQDGSIIDSYPVRGLPTTFIISPEGRVTHRIIGSREWDEAQLIGQLLELATPSR